MKDRPRFRSSLAHALLSAVTAAGALAGCGDDPAVSNGELDATGALTGTLQSFVADFRTAPASGSDIWMSANP